MVTVNGAVAVVDGIVEGCMGAGMMFCGGGGGAAIRSATVGIRPETAAVISVAETNES